MGWRFVLLAPLLALFGCQPAGYILELDKSSPLLTVNIYDQSNILGSRISWSDKVPCVERIIIQPELREENDPMYLSLRAKSGCVPLQRVIIGRTPSGFTVERAYSMVPGKRYFLELEGSEHRNGSILIEF